MLNRIENKNLQDYVRFPKARQDKYVLVRKLQTIAYCWTHTIARNIPCDDDAGVVFLDFGGSGRKEPNARAAAFTLHFIRINTAIQYWVRPMKMALAGTH